MTILEAPAPATPSPQRRHTEVLRELLGDATGLRVLDIGAGAGELAAWMNRQGARVTALEPQPARLAAARSANPGPGYACACAEELPLPSAAFDVVLFFNSLHHVREPAMPAALAEAARVLCDGGRLLVFEPLAAGARFELTRMLEDETQVRAAAERALDRSGAYGFARLGQTRYERTAIHRDLDALIRQSVEVDPARADRVALARDELARRFERLGEPTPEGRAFAQPMRADLLRKRDGAVAIELVRSHAGIRQALRIRQAVFVDEQGLPMALEWDEHDADARHLLLTVAGEAVGAARLRSLPGEVGKLERVAILPDWRRRGLARSIVAFALAELAAQGLREVVVHAQAHRREVYAALGFVAEGEPFDEAGIPHLVMRHRLVGDPFS